MTPPREGGLTFQVIDVVQRHPGITTVEVIDRLAPTIAHRYRDERYARVRISYTISHVRFLTDYIRREGNRLYPKAPARYTTDQPHPAVLVCRAERAKRATRDAERMARCRDLLDEMEARQHAGRRQHQNWKPLNVREVGR